jgi:glycosyltransferase involved in cell wall biosynthesis
MNNTEQSNTKVFHFLPGNAIGGISIQTVEVARLLNEQGYENVVIVPDEVGELSDLTTRHGIRMKKLSYGLPKHFEDVEAILSNVGWGFRFVPSVLKLRQSFRQERPDIVHINGLLLIQPAIAAWLEGIDIVWYLVSDGIYPEWLVSVIIPLVNHIATEIVLISESNKEFYHQEGKDVSIIPGAIDTDEINPESVAPAEIERLAETFEISEDTTVITTIGKVNQRKGQECAIEALRSLKGKEFSYLIVGPNRDKEYVETLQQMIREYDLENRIYITGFVENKLAVLSLTDIFLLPSIGEGTPLSIMEALAMKTPVIASDVGGVPELLASGEAGQLIPPRSPDAVKQALRRYLDDPELTKEHASRGSEIVQSEYSITEVAGKYSDVYSSCLMKQ